MQDVQKEPLSKKINPPKPDFYAPVIPIIEQGIKDKLTYRQIAFIVANDKTVRISLGGNAASILATIRYLAIKHGFVKVKKRPGKCRRCSLHCPA